MYRQSSGRVGAGARQSAAAPSKPQAATSQQQQGGAVKRMSLTDFEKLVTIAKGSFGVVYKATRKDNGRVYALKQVEIAEMNRAEREEAVDEVRARRHFRSPPWAFRSDAKKKKSKNESGERALFKNASIVPYTERRHNMRISPSRTSCFHLLL